MGLIRAPTPSISTLTTSPGVSHCGSGEPAAQPDGVPVAIRSPG